MSVFPDVAPGHWTTPEGAQMARDTIKHSPTRELLAYGHNTDFELANRLYMANRDDLNLTGLQTAGKQRIRWLSANLALALELLQTAHDVMAEPSDEVPGSEEWFEQAEALLKIKEKG